MTQALSKAMMNPGGSFGLLFLVLQVAVTQGKVVKLGKVGDTVELPCRISQRKHMLFTWKFLNETKILENRNSYVMRGQTNLQERIDSKSSQWDRGSFPLIIGKLEMKDSETYVCEVDKERMMVELRVFRLIATSGTRLLQGQTLSLSVEGPQDSSLSVQFTDPQGQTTSGKKAILVSYVGFQHSGLWKCNISQGQDELLLDINISVLGFQKTQPSAVYKKEGEQVEFSFPLTFREDLSGELRWQVDGASSFQSWITFSVQNNKVSVRNSTQDPKLQMAETTPLSLTLSPALLQHAGSGNLTLILAGGLRLHQEVNLVVMRAAQKQNSLVCEVLGPTSSTLLLSWKLENQKPRVSKQEKQVEVPSPEAGMWQCLLSDGDQVLLESKVEAVSTGLTQDQSMLLAVVLGSTLGFLFLARLCIFCCVKCRKQRRQAARMSQIKRLLSEKKTCQCHHRLQEIRNVT